ncbi:nucleoporin-interacting protein [Cohnella faecalis]|uniref:Nucleoporin-interacting protein n=1 Tax=Cohnella faecalis TaxID=2315694 RepID=A0A398CEX5_9BACL|nr:nucleoporin-interacting protein [Cohnella faecalis]RIE00432.1 nucleoporin-interacting protein [Cohnella faecalis]
MPVRTVRTIALSAAAVVLIGLCGINLAFGSPFVHSWDEVDFAYALDRYDLLAMQPHFPGYPYFIAGAAAIHRWIADPVRSLTVFNAMLALSSSFPIALLARRWVGAIPAWWATVWVAMSPYLWLMGSRAMSECAGIAVLWWYLWSVRESADKPRSAWKHIVAVSLFGLLMGIRLSFFPFGVGLVLLWALRFRSYGSHENRFVRLGAWVVAASAAQAVWIGGLIMSEGTPAGFWKLSKAFVAGHFSEWGGGVAATRMPILERMATIFGDHLIGDVLLSRSVDLGIFYLILLAAIVWGVWTLRGERAARHPEMTYAMWLGVGLAAYAIWALLGQNVEKPRHIAPVAGPILLAIYIVAVRLIGRLWRASADRRGSLRVVAAAIGMTLAGVYATEAIHGFQLLERQAAQKPAVYQLHDYLSSMEQPFVVYTWEETRVLGYLGASYEHRRIVTFDYFRALSGAAPGSRVLLTDHVLKGFLSQNPEAGAYVRPIAHFRSESLFEPVYAEITLYEWKKPV